MGSMRASRVTTGMAVATAGPEDPRASGADCVHAVIASAMAIPATATERKPANPVLETSECECLHSLHAMAR
jgi:hypothetical protein